ncbi:hypothetical protein [Streptomyces sp. NPDC048637]|uniref:hypothetical protein n=1 Tax=Streptomyces sp. NPDC048637 TaxID=3155636 RepID=UPI003449A927
MTTPDLPMLLPPAMVPDPSPLHVSTFAKPEYAKLTFTYGTVKSGANWPVHCKWFKVRVPTGRHASALTSEPTLIRSEFTVPSGKRQWNVERDVRDPNQVVFTCSSPPDEPAAFDGTWSVQLELWGIEVNGGAGPVDITWEESTSTTGADGAYQNRTGRGEVSKRDDSFYLHSFRPASVVINRSTKATLHWDGTPHAVYTMHYRKPDGTQDSRPAKDGTWITPENLVDDTSFTLEATMGNETRYLTTYIKVNNPDIIVNTATAGGVIRAHDGITGPNDTRPLEVRGGAGLLVHKSLDVGTYAGGTTTIRNPLTANGNLTVHGSTVTGDLEAKGHVTATQTNKVVRIRDLRGPVKSGGQTVDPPLNIQSDVTVNQSKTFKVRYVTGLGTYPAIDFDAHLNLSTPGRTTTVRGPLVTKGNVTFDQKSLHEPPQNNTVSVKSTAALQGRVDAVGAPVLIAEFVVSSPRPDQQRTFTAQTSGFVLARAHAGGGAEHVRLTITTQGRSIEDDAHGTSRAGKNSMAVPVAAGRDFTVRAVKQSGAFNDRWAVGYFYWVPLGTGTATAKTVMADTDPPAPDTDTYPVDDGPAAAQEGP